MTQRVTRCPPAAGAVRGPPIVTSTLEEHEVLSSIQPSLLALPFSKETFKKLIYGCGLPRSFLRVLMGRKSHFSKTHHEEEDEDSTASRFLQTGKTSRSPIRTILTVSKVIT
jgi:hypothetical protein